MNFTLRRLGRVTLLVLVSWVLVSVTLAAAVHYTGTVDQPDHSDVIIVLGAALSRDGTPYKALTRRSEHAATLWQGGRAASVLCTGGVGPHVSVPRSEADGCREVLVRAGVPASAIVLEENSANTEDQINLARDVMARHGWRRATLVSDSYHVFRARHLARRAGMDVTLSPVPAARVDSPAFYVLSLVREVAALQASVLHLRS